jgi:hypothetical protein
LSLRRGRVTLSFLEISARPCLEDRGDGEECDRGSLNRMTTRNMLDAKYTRLLCLVTVYVTTCGASQSSHVPNYQATLLFPKSRLTLFPMADSKPIVYLEDIETSTKNASIEATSSTATNASNRTFFSTSKPSGKRQRTLADMFSSSQGKIDGDSERPVKKTKITVQGTASLSKLNSIPFSLSAFQESLSEQEKQFLALECDTMGKSWYVIRKN